MNNCSAVGSIDPRWNTISALTSRDAMGLNRVGNNSWSVPKKNHSSNRQALDRHISTESRVSAFSDGSVLSTVSESSSHSSGASSSVVSTEVMPVVNAEKLLNSRIVYSESTTRVTTVQYTAQYSYLSVLYQVSNDDAAVNQPGLQPASQAAIGHNDVSANDGSKSKSLCDRLFPCISKRK